MQNATPDDYSLAMAIEPRLREFIDTYVRTKGQLPPMSLEVKRMMILWRRMQRRLASGDNRCEPDEVKATKELAQWLVDVNCDLKGQERKILPFTTT